MNPPWFKKYSLDWPTPLYVLLLAAFPVLFLYSYNVRDMSDAGQLVTPLALCIACTFLLWLLITLILHDGRKAGLSLALFLVFFFSYGRLYELLQNWHIFMPKHSYLLGGALLIWGYGVYFISRMKSDLRTTTMVINVMATVLIIMNLGNMAIYQITKPQIASSKPVTTISATDNATGAEQFLPDIYFIILDEYAHPDTIKDWAGYDNSRFIKSLEAKGFYIASNSLTRASMTPQAIAQVLNMEYLTEGWYWDIAKNSFVENISAEAGDARISPWDERIYQKIAYNKVAALLRSEGYKWVYLGSWIELGRWGQSMKSNADIYFNYYLSDKSGFVKEFQNILWKTTMIRPFYNNITGEYYPTYHRQGVTKTLEQLKRIPDIEGPKFVFAHIACPHDPLVFGPQGEFVAPVHVGNYKDKQFYLGQYIFITTEIEKVVDELLKKSKVPPIIILQSDHGLRPHRVGISIDTEAWRHILNALYLPGLDKAVLYDSISPVNTFRLIFSHYFGADYPLLKDD